MAWLRVADDHLRLYRGVVARTIDMACANHGRVSLQLCVPVMSP